MRHAWKIAALAVASVASLVIVMTAQAGSPPALSFSPTTSANTYDFGTYYPGVSSAKTQQFTIKNTRFRHRRAQNLAFRLVRVYEDERYLHDADADRAWPEQDVSDHDPLQPDSHRLADRVVDRDVEEAGDE